MAKKQFTLDKYEEIKKVLEDNKISSKDLDKYIRLKSLRYDRYRELNNLTDAAMITAISNDYDKKFTLVNDNCYVDTSNPDYDVYHCVKDDGSVYTYNGKKDAYKQYTIDPEEAAHD